jgi:hypothetical protein
MQVATPMSAIARVTSVVPLRCIPTTKTDAAHIGKSSHGSGSLGARVAATRLRAVSASAAGIAAASVYFASVRSGRTLASRRRARPSAAPPLPHRASAASCCR